jgi:hypothetical protein
MKKEKSEVGKKKKLIKAKNIKKTQNKYKTTKLLKKSFKITTLFS